MEQKEQGAAEGSGLARPAELPQAAGKTGAAAQLQEPRLHGGDRRVQAGQLLPGHQEPRPVHQEEGVAARAGQQGEEGQEESGRKTKGSKGLTALSTNHRPGHHPRQSAWAHPLMGAVVANWLFKLFRRKPVGGLAGSISPYGLVRFINRLKSHQKEMRLAIKRTARA